MTHNRIRAMHSARGYGAGGEHADEMMAQDRAERDAKFVQRRGTIMTEEMKAVLAIVGLGFLGGAVVAVATVVWWYWGMCW